MQKRKSKRGGGGGNAQPKWCSYHNITTHSDAERWKQQELCPKKQKELLGLIANLALLHYAGQVNLPNIGCAHLAQSTPATALQAPAEPTLFGFPFCASRASPAAATSCSAFSRRLRRRLPPLRQHLHLSPQSRVHRTTACLQGFSVRSWRHLRRCRLLLFAQTGRASGYLWTAERPTTTILRLHKECGPTFATSETVRSLPRSSPPASISLRA